MPFSSRATYLDYTLGVRDFLVFVQMSFAERHHRWWLLVASSKFLVDHRRNHLAQEPFRSVADAFTRCDKWVHPGRFGLYYRSLRLVCRHSVCVRVLPGNLDECCQLWPLGRSLGKLQIVVGNFKVLETLLLIFVRQRSLAAVRQF